MKCPICDIEMRTADREGVEIDYCTQCRGVWLDRGELEKIIARVESQDSSDREPNDEGEDNDYDRDAMRDSSRGRDREARRDDRYRRDEPNQRSEESPRGGKKREGFLSNLMEIFGGG